MISCFNNLIGVRGVAGYEQPDSGLFLNDLEGITSDKLEDLSDIGDHYEPRLVFDDIFTRATHLMESDIATHVNKNFKNWSERYNEITSHIDESTDINSSAVYNGWQFDFGIEDQNKVIDFNTVAIYLSEDTNFEVKVFDLNTGETLDTIGFSGTQGLNEYRIMKTYPLWKYNRLFIAYDATNVTTKATTRYRAYMGTVTIGQVSTSQAVTVDNITTATTGMMLNYSIACSLDNFICQRLNTFKTPFLYKLGIEFCKEWLHTDRINRWGLSIATDPEGLLESFKEEYQKLLHNSVKDIKVEAQDDCFECARGLTFKQMI